MRDGLGLLFYEFELFKRVALLHFYDVDTRQIAGSDTKCLYRSEVLPAFYYPA